MLNVRSQANYCRRFEQRIPVAHTSHALFDTPLVVDKSMRPRRLLLLFLRRSLALESSEDIPMLLGICE